MPFNLSHNLVSLNSQPSQCGCSFTRPSCDAKSVTRAELLEKLAAQYGGHFEGHDSSLLVVAGDFSNALLTLRDFCN